MAKPNDYVVAAMVSDAIRIVETTPITPPPWVELVKKPRSRPSDGTKAIFDEHVFPSPHWGLNINLSSSYMGIEQASRIARLMLTNQTVTTLDLSMCDLFSEGCEALVKCLKRNYVLRHLALNGNRIGPRGAVALAEYLSMNDSQNACNTAVPVTIAPVAFAGCSEVRPFYIPPHQGLNSSPTGVPSQTLDSPKDSPNVAALNLGKSGAAGGGLGIARRSGSIEPEEMSSRVPKPYPVTQGLYKTLALNTEEDDMGITPPSYLTCPLESLSLSHNAIGDEGAVAIMNALRTNTTLTFLNLRSNNITNLGAFAILDTLADHFTLEDDMKRANEAAALAAKNAKKNSKGKGKAKKQSVAPARQRSVRPARSCLQDRLRFDVEVASSSRADEAPAMPILFELLFSLTAMEGVPELVTVPTADEAAMTKAEWVKKRWSHNMTAEQKQEVLAFLFPFVFHRNTLTESSPNPLLSEAAAVLHDGNATLQLSILNAPTPTHSTIFPPLAAKASVNQSSKADPKAFVPRQHRAPTEIENAGGYFYPTVMQCEGRPATLTEPAMLAAPNEKVWFTLPDGSPHTIGYARRSTALCPSVTYKNAATVLAATAMQFIQSCFVHALSSNVAAAAAAGYVPPTDSVPADSNWVQQATEGANHARLKAEAAKAVADDYHQSSASLAIFAREDRQIGEVGAKPLHSLTTSELASLDPFDKDNAPEEFIRFSDGLPMQARPSDPAKVLPKVLQPKPLMATPPLRPTKPVSAKSLANRPVTQSPKPSDALPERTDHPEDSLAPDAGTVNANPQLAAIAMPRRKGSATVDSVVVGVPQPPDLPLALYPAELLFLECLGYFGGSHLIKVMAEATAQRQTYEHAHAEQDKDSDMMGWQVMQPSARTVATEQGTPAPPYGQLSIRTFQFGVGFPNYHRLSEANSPYRTGLSGWPDADEARASPDLAHNWPIEGSLEGGLVRKRPLAAATVPPPMLSSRLQAVAKIAGNTHSTFSSDADLADRALASAKQLFTAWISDVSVLGLNSLPEGPGTPSDGRRSRSTPMVPSPPPTAGGKGPLPGMLGRSIVSAAILPSLPKNINTKQSALEALSSDPHLPYPLPLPRVSLREVADAAAVSMFGSLPVAEALMNWVGTRKDVRSAEGSCPTELLKLLVPSTATGVPSVPPPDIPRLKLRLPLDAEPYLPLAETIMSLMHSPLYSLVDPLTALLRGRTRMANGKQRGSDCQTAEGIATAIALLYRGSNSHDIRGTAKTAKGNANVLSPHRSVAQLQNNKSDETFNQNTEREAVRLINKSFTDGFVTVSATSIQRLSTSLDASTAEGDEAHRPSLVIPSTIDGLLELAQSELEQAADLAADLASEATPAPPLAVTRNTSITSVWFESNAIDPQLARALTMALQVRCPPKTPVGFNKKVLKEVLSRRDAEEKQRVYPSH